MSTSTPARGAIRRGRGTVGSTVRTTAALATFALTAGLVLAPALPASAATPRNAGPGAQATTPKVTSVTLVTGDVVRVTRSSDGRKAITLQPRPDGTIPQAAISEANGHTYVVPTAAFGLLAANRLDRSLFDVTAADQGRLRRRVPRHAPGDGRLRQGRQCGQRGQERLA